MEKEIHAYIGDIVGSLIKEASFYKNKCLQLESELQNIKANKKILAEEKDFENWKQQQ
jgi:hypothetical protein